MEGEYCPKCGSKLIYVRTEPEYVWVYCPKCDNEPIP